MYTVYRHHDKDGNIIYVGKSKNLLYRQRQHRDNSEWFKDIAKIDYIILDSSDDMDKYELNYIYKHNPINNKNHKNRIVHLPDIEFRDFDMGELFYSYTSVPKSKRMMPLNIFMELNKVSNIGLILLENIVAVFIARQMENV